MGEKLSEYGEDYEGAAKCGIQAAKVLLDELEEDDGELEEAPEEKLGKQIRELRDEVREKS